MSNELTYHGINFNLVFKLSISQSISIDPCALELFAHFLD